MIGTSFIVHNVSQSFGSCKILTSKIVKQFPEITKKGANAEISDHYVNIIYIKSQRPHVIEPTVILKTNTLNIPFRVRLICAVLQRIEQKKTTKTCPSDTPKHFTIIICSIRTSKRELCGKREIGFKGAWSSQFSCNHYFTFGILDLVSDYPLISFWKSYFI